MIKKKKFLFNPEQSSQVIGAGEYAVTLKDFDVIDPVEIKGREVQRLHTVFEFDENREIHHNMLMLPGRKYLPSQLIYAITGEYSPCDIADLIGYRVVVNVVHKTSEDGTVYANIDAIYPCDDDEDFEEEVVEEDFEEGIVDEMDV
ncbi:MAG: hypothetical protein E7A63_17725 [Clostridium butyricum]|nr:hypothetical protein [Clostridium butyricum]